MTIPIRPARPFFTQTTRKPRQIRRAKMALFEVHDVVIAQIARCRSANLEPVEVWLGPDEAEAVTEGLKADPGLYAFDPRRGLEGHKFATLTIRLSKTPGVRVGVTVG